MNRKHFVIVGIVFLLWRIAFRAGQQGCDGDFKYLQFAPNCYRLWDHFLLYLHDTPFSYVMLSSTVWAASILGMWYLARPDEMDTLALIIGTVATSAFGSIRAGPQYLLLATLAVTGNPAILLLLVAVKEYAVIVGVLYLVIYRRDLGGKRIILWVIFAGLFYLGIHYIIGSMLYAPSGAPMVTPQYVLARLPNDIEWIMMQCVPIIIMLVLVIRDRRDVLFLLLCGVFVFTFGLFWEMQLWLAPATIIITQRRKKR